MILVAVDAGGTHTRSALLTAGGEVLGTGQGGPANWSTLGPEAVVEAVRIAVDAARASAGAEYLRSGSRQVTGACVSLAGYYPPWHAAEVERALAPVCGAALRVEPDLRAAWAGAMGLGAGVVVAAGTGSVAYGEDGAGRSARAGGWGPLAGDEGSAAWIGAAALRALARTLDGRGPDGIASSGRSPGALPLANLLGPSGASEGLAAPEEWLRGIYRDRWGRAEVGALAPLVAEAAAAGDRVAGAILAEAGGALAELALAVLRALGLERGGAPVSVTGGVFAAGEPLLQPFRRWLSTMAPAARLAPPLLSPLGGAALLAQEQFALAPGATAEKKRQLLSSSAQALRASSDLFLAPS